MADPRRAVRRILDHEPGKAFVFLALVEGICLGMRQATRRDMVGSMGYPETIAFILLASPLLHVVILWIWSGCTTAIGQFFGSDATAQEVRTAVVWGTSPILWTLPFWAIQIFLFAPAMFAGRSKELMAAEPLYLALEFVKIVPMIGGFYCLCKSLGEALGFSAWGAFGILLLTAGFVFGFLLVAAICIAVAIAAVG